LYKDIHFRKLSNGLRSAGGGAVVGSKFFQLRGRHAGTDVGDGGFNASGGASVDYHRNAFTGKGRSYFFADAASRGCDKGECVIELKVHEGYFLKETANVEQGGGPRHLGGPSSTIVRRCANDQKHVPDPLQ